MAQYIEKSALVAEIERRQDMITKGIFSIPLTGRDRAFATFEYEILGKIKDFLDTLEVKEVDLSKEIDNYFDNYKFAEKEECWLNHDQVHIFAKHFFELGLKAHKGE